MIRPLAVTCCRLPRTPSRTVSSVPTGIGSASRNRRPVKLTSCPGVTCRHSAAWAGRYVIYLTSSGTSIRCARRSSRMAACGVSISYDVVTEGGHLADHPRDGEVLLDPPPPLRAEPLPERGVRQQAGEGLRQHRGGARG